MDEEQLLLPLEDDDLWFLPHDDSETLIARVNGRYYLWENEKALCELIPTPIIIDDSL